MKVSTKGRYAIKLLLDIAVSENGKPIRIKDIAARQQVSNKYLEQIVSTLNKAGYVKSVRGPHGGYLLAKDPSEYTVGMVLRLMEGSLSPVKCVENPDYVCDRKDECVTSILWMKLNDAINGVIDHTTIADLAEWHYNLTKEDKKDE